MTIATKRRRVTGDEDASSMVQTQEIHCPGCGRFLGFQAVVWGMVKIKCHGCKEWTTIDIRPEHPVK